MRGKTKIPKEFLEKRSLYSSTDCQLPDSSSDLEGENINLYCKTCKSTQTFVLNAPFFERKNLYKLPRSKGIVAGGVHYKEEIKGFLFLDYKCAHCNEERAIFIIKISDNKCEKIGQYPPLDISIPAEIKSLKNPIIEDLYKKARISENFSYGIGAFAYYRRIVELEIDELLEKIKELFPDDKKERYQKILEQVKREKNADKKIDIVKEVITNDIIPNNPLKSLYKILSKGIHNFSDKECLESASAIRDLLIILIKEIENKKEQQNKLMKAQKIIDKFNKK